MIQTVRLAVADVQSDRKLEAADRLRTARQIVQMRRRGNRVYGVFFIVAPIPNVVNVVAVRVRSVD